MTRWSHGRPTTDEPSVVADRSEATGIYPAASLAPAGSALSAMGRRAFRLFLGVMVLLAVAIFAMLAIWLIGSTRTGLGLVSPWQAFAAGLQGQCNQLAGYLRVVIART
jgi:hypothetical protein